MELFKWKFNCNSGCGYAVSKNINNLQIANDSQPILVSKLGQSGKKKATEDFKKNRIQGQVCIKLFYL